MLSRSLLPLILLAPLLAPGVAQAKDLRQRVAVGANAHLGSVPALSVRYGLPTPDPAINVQLEATAGFWAYGDQGTKAVGGGRVLYGMVAEDNMNLFLGVGAGAVTETSAATVDENGDSVQTSSTAARIQPVMGADFFLFGLENLGFTAEWGVNIDLGSSAGVATSAALGGGVHYWF